MSTTAMLTIAFLSEQYSNGRWKTVEHLPELYAETIEHLAASQDLDAKLWDLFVHDDDDVSEQASQLIVTCAPAGAHNLDALRWYYRRHGRLLYYVYDQGFWNRAGLAIQEAQLRARFARIAEPGRAG